MTEGPHVSVLIPARNEERNIGACLKSLANQTYKNYDIVVLNDNSTDQTQSIIDKISSEFPGKITSIQGKPLEQGWNGKSFAMNQLIQRAKGEYLLFTDADTIHTNMSVSFAITNLIENKADMVSGFIHQNMYTFGERMIVPIMYILTMVAIPIWANKMFKSLYLATAIGQYIAVKATSFKASGGYEEVKNKTTEDIYLARLMKKHGFSVYFLDPQDAASCRMYQSYKDAVNGLSKNIFDFLGKHSIIFLLAILGIFVFLVVPFPALLINLLYHFATTTSITLLSIALMVNVFCSFFTWHNVCKFQKQPEYIALLYPVLLINLLYVAILSWIKSKKGMGFTWKGRIVS